MPRTAIQLFTLRDLDESLDSTLGRVAETNFEGVEFAGLDGADPDRLANRLDELGLVAVGAHVGIDTIEEEFDEVIERYRQLGCRRLVVPTYDQEAFATREGAEAAAVRLSAAASDLAAEGFDLLYHNHTFEFTDLGDCTAFDVFVDAADGVGIELDTGLAQFAGADPERLLDRYADSVELLHATDSRAGSESTVHVELGAGQVDLDACVELVDDLGIEWAIYEHGRTSDPLASLAHGDATLSALLGSSGESNTSVPESESESAATKPNS